MKSEWLEMVNSKWQNQQENGLCLQFCCWSPLGPTWWLSNMTLFNSTWGARSWLHINTNTCTYIKPHSHLLILQCQGGGGGTHNHIHTIEQFSISLTPLSSCFWTVRKEKQTRGEHPHRWWSRTQGLLAVIQQCQPLGHLAADIKPHSFFSVIQATLNAAFWKKATSFQILKGDMF